MRSAIERQELAVSEPRQLGSFLKDLAAGGPYKCQSCDVLIELPGVCEECYERETHGQDLPSKDLRKLRLDRMCAGVLATIPKRFAWAAYSNRHMSTRMDGWIAENPGRDDPVEWSREAITKLVIRREVQNIVLQGPTGVGKTAIACAMARGVVLGLPNVGCRMMFVSSLDLATCRREAKWGERPKLLDRAIRSSLLVYDDLFQEKTGFDVATEIIFARENLNLPTVYTTFATQQEIADRYGGGAMRRIFALSAVYEWSQTCEPVPHVEIYR